MMVAVGDSGGTLHILEIPWNLSQPSTNEVTTEVAFFYEIKEIGFTVDYHGEFLPASSGASEFHHREDAEKSS